MLINTVVLFLKDILPVFLMLSLLLAYRHVLENGKRSIEISPLPQFHHHVCYLLLLGLVMSAGVIAIVPPLSNYLDGSGAELFYAAGYLIIYLLIVAGILWERIRLLLVSLVLLTMFRGADFLVYLQGFWSVQAFGELVIATLLGGGICMSIAILMYFFCCALSRWSNINSASFLLVAFATGYLLKTTHLLMQADFMSNAQPLYNSNTWLNESSEVGYFMVALVGYDASPTLLKIIIYGLGIGIPVWLVIKRRTPQTINLKALS